MIPPSLSYRQVTSWSGGLSDVGPSPIDQPVTPSTCPSIHQPSRTLKLGIPFKAAFMPLVPEASWGLWGVFSHRSTPEQISFARDILPGIYCSPQGTLHVSY